MPTKHTTFKFGIKLKPKLKPKLKSKLKLKLKLKPLGYQRVCLRDKEFSGGRFS